ncbi:ABC transporter ATP-binding protein [Paenibacillus sp. OV219]|uniref:ABC transporter ATP-binding protein n=1 Tax=Paenibacillus sp. OV219 TaxID=1884377 RepID=UPI0008B3A108|nr:ABC transporter ATP-binding protein [Paenibacillus sp. OV219]SEO94973.1 ABC-2 type transport system ATP-binding protein [Paenibacillus sp. OV219]
MNRLIYEIDQVSHVYKGKKRSIVKANDNISFDIPAGEILGILGPNGAGKSTLIKQMVGLLKPTEGQVLFDGTNIAGQTKRAASLVAYYAQEPHVLAPLKVHEALEFTGRLRGMSKEDATRQTKDLLEQFEMSKFRDKQLKQLSGGQKRMIGIGTVLIGHSPVLILDEPTNELDPRNRRLVWDMINMRNREGATIILVTHNVLEAEQVVHRVAVINHGKLLAIDSVAKLKQQVDPRLKFELFTSIGTREEIEAMLARFGTVQVLSENRLLLLAEKRDASELLDFITSHPELPILEYSIKPSSLEDVYFHIDNAAQNEVIGL